MPSDADIFAEQARLGASRPRVPAFHRGANTFPAPITPPKPLGTDGKPVVPGIDLQQIAAQYRERLEAEPREALYILVSWSMPKASLHRVMTQAHRAGAAVVMRGFKNNSWRDTAFALDALKRAAADSRSGPADVHVSVDPALFTRFAVETVPTVVLSIPRPGLMLGQVALIGALGESQEVAVSGDVSLTYVLEHIADRAPAFASAARRFKARL